MNSVTDWYADAEQREQVKKKRMSNADRIRQMTDDELATFMVIQALMGAVSANGISDRQSAEDIVKDVIKSKPAEIDIENAKDWLKQEVNTNDDKG